MTVLLFHESEESMYQDINTEWFSLADIAGQMGHNEADLGYFAYQHLPEHMINISTDGSVEVSEEGVELLHAFIPVRQ